MERLSLEKFIEKARFVYGNKYDYSLVTYKNSRTKVKIICPIHGEFEQEANGHLQGYGCKKCGYEKNGLQFKKTTEQFIKEAREIHGNKYDYSLVEYLGALKKVKIICPIHGIFEQTSGHHIGRKDGCPKCNEVKKIERFRSLAKGQILTTEQFIERAKEVHGDKYDYSLVEYIGSFDKIKIICHAHGIFEQIPSNHVYFGNGCPKCNSSHGELKIRKILLENNIAFEEQKTFDECKNIHKLRFDFYLPESNLCIEYQGRQHFAPYSFGEKSLEKFERQKVNDNIKRNYCISKGIKLLEIKFDEDLDVKLTEGVIDEYVKRTY